MPNRHPTVNEQRDDRSSLARVVQVSSQMTTIAGEMVVPILLGAWIDGRAGTKGLFAIIGGAIGITVGIWSLLRLVQPPRRNHRPGSVRKDHPRQPSP